MKFEELFKPKPGSLAAEMQKTIDGLNQEIKELRDHAERVGEANDRLVVENDALRADKERLDWMQRVKLTVLHHKGKVFGRGVKVPSTRQAIDAAMKEGK